MDGHDQAMEVIFEDSLWNLPEEVRNSSCTAILHPSVKDFIEKVCLITLICGVVTNMYGFGFVSS